MKRTGQLLLTVVLAAGPIYDISRGAPVARYWINRMFAGHFWDWFNGLLTLGFWALVAYLIYRWWNKRQAYEAAKPTMQSIPAYDDGPMKVEIAFQEIPAPSTKHSLYGGSNWWRMHMNIRFSNKDWKLFEKSGMADKEMFSHPGQEFPEIDTSFAGQQLRYMPNHRDFPDIQTAEAAKETLIRNLHTVRARIDDMKGNRGGGIERERIEI